MHEHSWYFTLQPGRWTATCACGLAVAVEEPEPGRSIWRWTLDGKLPPTETMLNAIGSVQRARHALLVRPFMASQQ